MDIDIEIGEVLISKKRINTIGNSIKKNSKVKMVDTWPIERHTNIWQKRLMILIVVIVV